MIKEKDETLFVYLNESLIGYLKRINMKVSFSYTEDAKRNISISLPREEENTIDFQVKVSYFLDNLLPEGNARKFLLHFFSIPGKAPFDILKILGREVAGALIFCPDTSAPVQNYAYKDVTQEVEHYLEKSRHGCIQEAIPSRMSLAGVQDKLAVVYREKKIFIPVDFSPTSHIIKPDSPDFLGTARNEHLCLSVAEKLGFAVCGHELLTHCRRDIVLLTRYDRIESNGSIKRLHQEDFCQAMGIPASYKYQGVGYDKFSELGIVALFETAKLAGLEISQELAKRCALFYFIGNFDAHAKNYSLLYTDDGCKLAPIYDCLCIPAVASFDRTLSIDIGGKMCVDDVSLDSFLALGYDLNFPEIEKYALYLVNTIPDLVYETVQEHRKLYGDHPIYERIINECALICTNFKKLTECQKKSYIIESKEEYLNLCKDDPLQLKEISIYEQTEELVRVACENCRNKEGVSPGNLLKYIRDDLKYIVNEYRGYWGIDLVTNEYKWFYDKQ